MKNDAMSDYLHSLTAPVPHHAPPDTQVVDEWRQTNRSLRDRLSDLLKTIPAAVKRDGLHLRDLQALLEGRSTRKGRPVKTCDHGELGDALRSLGFRRSRQWNRPDQGFCAVWKLED